MIALRHRHGTKTNSINTVGIVARVKVPATVSCALALLVFCLF